MKKLLIFFLLFTSIALAGDDAGLAGAAYIRAGNALPLTGGTVSGPSTFSSALGVVGSATFGQRVTLPDGSLLLPAIHGPTAGDGASFSPGFIRFSIGGVRVFDMTSVAAQFVTDWNTAYNFYNNNVTGGFWVSKLAASSTTATYGFYNDTRTGPGRFATGEPSMVASGVEAMRWTNATSTAIGDFRVASQSNFVGTATFGARAYFPDGTTAFPGIAFASDTSCGFYRPGANSFWAYANNAPILNFNTAYLRAYVDLYDGGATSWYLSRTSQYGTTTPNYTFAGDTNTGIHRFAADQPNVIANGAEVARWTATQTLLLQKPVLPSLASATIDGLTAVIAGSMVFNTGANKAQIFDGTYWQNCW